ncbi:MAG: hypothetical protein D6824_07285 [Planctomycetota bacterium]|nr:MAG: hypothetical protein D6824_07285 [Planctomycetota bacterium]
MMVQNPADDLIARVRAGDREAAAQFLMVNSELIRRRVRGRLGPALRRIFESEDIVSTVGRRLDEYIRKGEPSVRTEGELLGLILRMAFNAVVDKGRICNRLQRVEQGEEVFASQMLRQLQNDAAPPTSASAESVVNRALETLDDEIDCRILWMWLMDRRLQDIAETLNMTAPAVRMRWARIKEKLRPMLEPER